MLAVAMLSWNDSMQLGTALLALTAHVKLNLLKFSS